MSGTKVIPPGRGEGLPTTGLWPGGIITETLTPTSPSFAPARAYGRSGGSPGFTGALPEISRFPEITTAMGQPPSVSTGPPV